MDKARVQALLEAYRPQDAGDPLFADALREAERNPELAAWFAEMQQMDALLSEKLHRVSPPADLKERILLGRPASAAANTPTLTWRRALATLAALLIVGALSQHFLVLPRSHTQALAAQAVAYAGQMQPLQFVCFDAGAVAQWVNEQPASRGMGIKLTKPMEGLNMAMIGSSVVDWKGHPAVLICLQNGERQAMLYILKASDLPELPEEPEATVQQANWVVHTSRADGQVRVLTTRGTAKDLKFQTPF